MQNLRRSVACGALTCLGLVGVAEPRPNIVLIMADDLGFSDLGCYGAEIPTPNLDALAAEGVRFTQFYNGAVCCPSRAALLTGLHPHQAGMGWMTSHGADIRPRGAYQGYLNDRSVTLGEVLRSAGYQTFLSGKWHAGESRPHWPVDRGFDRSFALISGASNYFDLTKDYLPAGEVRTMAVDDRVYHPPADDFYITDAFTDAAINFVGSAGENPFFLYLAYTAPHFPLHASRAAIARHRGRYLEGWDRIRQRRYENLRSRGILGPQTALAPRDSAVPAWPDVAEPELMDERMAIYAAQVALMDEGIGRLMNKLRALGIRERTLVIFLSDNGGAAANLERFRAPHLNRPPHLGGPNSFDAYGKGWANVSNTPFREFKGTLYEGGIAAPLIIAGPGVKLPVGSLCHEPGHLIDFMPTLAELAGVAYPQSVEGRRILPMQGRSLLPALRGEAARESRALFWELEGQYAVREGDWKLIGGEQRPWQLFDLASDRGETSDLASAHPEVVQRLAGAHAAWMQRCGVEPWSKVSRGLQNIRGIR